MLCRGAPCCLEAGIGCPRQVVAAAGKLWLPQALALAAPGTGWTGTGCTTRGRDPLLPILELLLGLFGNATFEDADLLANFCF